MKRTLLAVAIPALLVAGAANASIEVWNKDGNKLEVNGRVKAMNHITDRNQVGEGDRSNGRIGFTGNTQIAEGFTGYGRFEYETFTGDNADNETRYAFAGLNFGDFGSIDYGRNDGVLKAITAYTDVLPEFGGDAANNDWNVLSARTKAVLTYRNNNFFGLTDDVSFALQYADDGDNSLSGDHSFDTTNQSFNIGKSREAFGATVQWNIFDTGLTAGAGYAQSTGKKSKNIVLEESTSGKPGKISTWAAGLKYDNYNLYLAANYFQSKLKDGLYFDVEEGKIDSISDLKIKGIELVAQYGIDLEVGRIIPSLAYVQHKVKDEDPEASGSSYLTKYVSLGATYEFNKNISAIVEYKFNLLDKDDDGAYNNTAKNVRESNTKAGTKDVLGIGLIYQF
ncbi:porin [Orbaceae bacterium ESL0721]|nr:porin [Orbaceae bacterium ESL0721]